MIARAPQEMSWRSAHSDSTLQGTIYTLFRNMRHVWHIRAYTELRVQINSSRFRVPDVTVLSASAPKEQIVRHPPLLCIEILSPEDTILRMKDRIQDYISLGVAQVWLFAPNTRTATICDGRTMVDVTTGSLTLPGTPITLSLAEVFRALDED